MCLEYSFFVIATHDKVSRIKIGKITSPLNVPFLLFSKVSKNTMEDFIYKHEYNINMSEQKELFTLISQKLDEISYSVKELNDRMDRLEGKTDDIHHYIPFVGWLEEVGRDISNRFLWLKGHRHPPLLLDNDLELEVDAELELELELELDE
jgi:hypothetical protein